MLVGLVLAKKEQEIINNSQKNKKDHLEEYFEYFEKNISEKFEKIIGSQIAEKLAKKLIEIEKKNNFKLVLN